MYNSLKVEKFEGCKRSVVYYLYHILFKVKKTTEERQSRRWSESWAARVSRLSCTRGASKVTRHWRRHSNRGEERTSEWCWRVSQERGCGESKERLKSVPRERLKTKGYTAASKTGPGSSWGPHSPEPGTRAGGLLCVSRAYTYTPCHHRAEQPWQGYITAPARPPALPGSVSMPHSTIFILFFTVQEKVHKKNERIFEIRKIPRCIVPLTWYLE